MRISRIVLTILFAANYAANAQPEDAPKDVYISIRKDGRRGSGTQTDPFDGSTAEKFDLIMEMIRPKTGVHLAKGAIFETNGLKWPDDSKGWTVKDGLHISGNGATVRLVSYPGVWTQAKPQKHVVIGNRYYEEPANNVVIENLTIDANWQNLSCPWTNKAVMCSFLYGSNNAYRRVRAMNMYGDSAGHTECFSLAFSAANVPGGGTNCEAEECVLEDPRGDYQAGILFTGWNDGNPVPDESKPLKHCRAIRNRVAGRFESGGINLAFVNGVLIAQNYFNDSQGVHHDTGSADNVVIADNVFNQIYQFGVDFERMSYVDRSNITIRGNTFRIPKSVIGAHTYGINMDTSGRLFRNVVIEHNSFIKEFTGTGWSLWRAMHLRGLSRAVVSNNTGDQGMDYVIEGTNVSRRNNRDFHGSQVRGLQ
jgi:hypothetical protein